MAKFPSIKEVEKTLIAVKRTLDKGESIDIRLQVHEGSWQLWTGDSQYDTDHRGNWGCGGLAKSTNCMELARELIDQVKDQAEIDNI